MSDASLSRKAFLADLRTIREEGNFTLDHILVETKIPLSTLKEFEETGLFDSSTFNKVYLRALVTSYARSVGIPTEIMLLSLEEATAGTYAGRLLKEPEEFASIADEPVQEEVAPDLQKESLHTTPPVMVEEPVQEETKPFAPARKFPPRNRFDQPWHWLWIAVIVGIVIVAGAIFFSVQQQATEKIVEPVPAVEEVTPTIILAPSLILEDPFHVILLSTQKLEGFRMTIDDDVSRQYWIGMGHMEAIEISQRLLIEHTRNFRLFVNGYEIPVATSPVVITREGLLEMAETLSSPSLPIPVIPDSLRFIQARANIRYVTPGEITGLADLYN